MATSGADSGGAHEAAERAYTALGEAHRMVARGLLLRLVPLDGDARRLPVIDLQDTDRAAALAHVLSVLERARVIAVDDAEITLADPALVQTWPRLRSWIEQDTSVLATAHGTIDAAQVWVRERFPATLLLRGERLKAALGALRDGGGDLLGPTARMFVLKSLERQRWWERKLLRRRIALVGVLVLVIGTISAISVVHRQNLEHNAALRSRRLIAAAKAAAATDPDLAVQFAVAAYRASPSPQAVQLMYGMLDRPADRVVGDMGSTVLRVAVQRNGSLAAAVSQQGSLRIWRLAGPGAPQLQATIRAHPTGLAFAPHGRMLAASCGKQGLCLWNLADPRHPAIAGRLPLPAHWPKTGVTSMAISPDGTLLAAATLSGHTLMWSIAKPGKPRLLHEFVTPAGGPLNDHLAAAAFAPRGKLLAITVQRNGAAGQAGHGTTELWNVTHTAHPASVAKIRGGYQSVAFSPNGSVLAAGGDTKVALWLLDSTGHPAPVSARPSCAVNPTSQITDIQSVSFSPDGGRLAYSGEDNFRGNANTALCLLDVSPASLYSGTPKATSIPTRYGTSDLTYTPDGALFTGGHDGVARLWREPVPQVDGLRTDNNASWGISDDGRLLAAPVAAPGPSADRKSFGVWDISSPGAPVLDAVIPVRTEMIFFLKGHALMTVVKGGAVRLWNLADPRHPVQAASLGRTSPVAPGGFSGMVTTDTAADLTSVLDVHGRLHLWKITRAPSAREVGSLPATDPSLGMAGVLADGRTALSLTATGITWWNVADPAHPVRGGASPLTDGLGVLDGGGSLLAHANRPGGKGRHATLKLFHLDKGRTASTITLTTDAGSQLGISPDARLLAATVTSDTALALWDVTDPARPRRRATFPVPQAVGIALSPTDRRLADWNHETVQLWDIHDPAAPVAHASLVPPPQARADEPVTGARFSANGRTVFVATHDSVFVYDADPAGLANRLCSTAGSPVSRTQWERYAPGIPYENPCPR